MTLEAILTDDRLDNWSSRNVSVARRLAEALIDENGELDKKALESAIAILQEKRYSLAPERHHDAPRVDHLLNVLRSSFWGGLKRIQAPEPDAMSVKLIRETLGLKSSEKVTLAHTRRVVLAALLTDLRQKIGSCFATAPAIVVQHEQPLQLIEDLRELIGTGRLTRVFEGVESTVPLALSWKFDREQENALLKGWEYTLASLSESKAEFAKWNLYASLGVRHDEPHGIGEGIYSRIQEMLEQMREELEGLQSRYDHLVAHLQSLQGRLERAETTGEIEWLRADYRMHRQELDRLQIEYNATQGKGERLAKLLPVMVEFYGAKIRDYFQEVYDAEMHEVSMGPYDDSPAGFRLLYKHGRSDPAAWTMIYNQDDYLQYLAAFFNVTELELSHLPETEGLEREISALVTECMTIIKRPEFLKSSLVRLARAYNEPDTGKRKPWAYISGGTMQTLVSHYYGLGQFPKEEKRWIESPTELLAFYIDTVKELPHAIQKHFRENSEASMLAFSPTHAFSCKPGWKALRTAWENKLYTYSWIRDEWHHPHLNFLDDNILDHRALDYLVDKIREAFPEFVLSTGRFPPSMRADEFRDYVTRARASAPLEEQVDALLYKHLPLFPEHKLKSRLHALLEQVEPEALPLVERVEPGRYHIFSADDLRTFAKRVLVDHLGTSHAALFYHARLTEAMQRLKLAYPAPILIGDTNWVKETFGFTVNPGTAEVDFWRFDVCGGEGRPISVWRRYLNGTDRREWGLYTDPTEYSIELN